MAVDANDVVVGANGAVYVAPAGTAVPTTPTAALNAAFIEVGYVSEEGVTFTGGVEQEDINAWQSFYPIRKLITARSAGVEFVMRQWNENTVKLAFGGGTIKRNGAVTTYVPPTPTEFDVRALVVQWADGVNDYRLVIPRGQVTGEVSTQLVRNSAADLPVSFEATPSSAASTISDPPLAAELLTQPWYLLNDQLGFYTT